MKRFLGLTCLALILIALCLQGARWQYDRHEVRQTKNDLIRANIDRPEISEVELSDLPANEVAWRKIQLTGNFIPSTEILVRNRYYQERYGFGVVTLFASKSGKSYWVDRGWVPPGPDALTPPIRKPVTAQLVTLTGRVRIEDIENQIGGTVFAIPGEDGISQLKTWNQQEAVDSEAVYIDLIAASNPAFNPDAPVALPALSAGPHLAYTFQWLLFAGFVVFGWFLVIREDRRARVTATSS